MDFVESPQAIATDGDRGRYVAISSSHPGRETSRPLEDYISHRPDKPSEDIGPFPNRETMFLINEEIATIRSDMTIHVKLKISALWATTMLCYIYGDLFGFFRQQTLTDIVSGHAGLIGTQAGLVAAAISVAVPSVMVVLSLVLKPTVSRWSNIILGLTYTIIILVTMPGTWMYYIFLSAIECVLTLLIVWYAWRWPKEAS